MTATRWDAIAAEVGLPANWRERGYDSPEYMSSPDSVYQAGGGLFYCWPGVGCSLPVPHP